MGFFNGLLMITDTALLPPPIDDSYVVLLLTGDGDNNSTTFIDHSQSNKTITPFGAAKISTRINNPFGAATGVMEFDGYYSGLLLENSSDFAYGTDDFTIEFWLYNESNPSDIARLYNPDGDYFNDLSIDVWTDGNMSTFATSEGETWGAWVQLNAFTIEKNQWIHCALVRHGNNVTFYKNGIGYLITASAPTLWHNTAISNICIGGQQASIPRRTLQGCLSNYRITKSVARYTANFTPPDAAF